MLLAAASGAAAAAAARRAPPGLEPSPRLQRRSPLLRRDGEPVVSDSGGDGRAAAGASVACRGAWIGCTLAFVGLFVVAGALPRCEPDYLFWPTLGVGAILWVVRASIDAPSCEEGDCEELSPSSQAHWSSSLGCFSLGMLLTMLSIKPYLTSMKFVHGFAGEGSIRDLPSMLHNVTQRPVQFFFSDGFVDANRTVTKPLCEGLPPVGAWPTKQGNVWYGQVQPLAGRYPPSQAAQSPPCLSRAALTIAPVFLSAADADTDGAVVWAWAQSDEHGALPGVTCPDEGGGLCAILPQAMLSGGELDTSMGVGLSLKTGAVHIFREEFPQYNVTDELPVLLFANPKVAKIFPSELAAAIVFYLLSCLLTCCPSALESAISRFGLDENDGGTGASPEELLESELALQRYTRPLSPREVRRAPVAVAASRLSLAAGAVAEQSRTQRLLAGSRHEVEFSAAAAAAAEHDRTQRLLSGGRQELEDGQEPCVICCLRPKDTLLAPCGHVATCHPCSEELKRRDQPCPICRSTLQAAYRVFNA